MRTLLWSYLGWHRFPRELSLFEVRRFFSLSLPDRHVLRRRFRFRARLGAAVIETLVSDSAGTVDRHRLARAAREALFAGGCLIPRGRDIDDWPPTYQFPRYQPLPHRPLCRAATPNSGLNDRPDAAQRRNRYS
jgi:hypothetical protein